MGGERLQITHTVTGIVECICQSAERNRSTTNDYCSSETSPILLWQKLVTWSYSLICEVSWATRQLVELQSVTSHSIDTSPYCVSVFFHFFSARDLAATRTAKTALVSFTFSCSTTDERRQCRWRHLLSSDSGLD